MQTIKATIRPMQRISAKIRAASAGRGGSGTEVVKIQYGFFDTDTEVVEVHYQNVISGTLPLAFKGTGKALDNYKIFGKSKTVPDTEKESINLLMPVDRTISGVTYTVDSNYYIAVPDNTDSRSVTEDNCDLSAQLTAGTYVLAFSGTPATISQSYAGFALLFNGQNLLGQLLNQAEQHYQFTIPSDGTVYLLTKRFNSRFKIMICKVEDWDGTVVPYPTKVLGVGVQLPSGKYRIPLSVNGSAINIDTNSPLYEGEYLSYLPDKTLPVIPTAAGDNIISANFTKTSLIGDGEDDLSNWNKNMSSFPIFENSYENGCNSLVYQGGSGYERIYLPVTINGEITFSFDYKTSGHNCSYGGDCNYAFISTAVPDTSAFLQMAGVVVSERLETAASDTTVHHNLSYSGKGLVYIGFDFGYIVDGITITLNFDHITVEGIKDIVPEIEITGEITESEGH